MSNIKDIEATQITSSVGNSTNKKELYIVVAENPTVKGTGSRVYLATRVDRGPVGAEIAGYEATKHNSNKITQLKNTDTYNDAVELAKMENAELEILLFPWHRIISIKTLKLVFLK